MAFVGGAAAQVPEAGKREAVEFRSRVQRKAPIEQKFWASALDGQLSHRRGRKLDAVNLAQVVARISPTHARGPIPRSNIH
jgi:hypothetical protein